jgi:hypothetical protein
MDRLWTRIKDLRGVRCAACKGQGSWIGYSPTQSLATFRTASRQYCGWCHDGYTTTETNARIREIDRRDKEFWRGVASGENLPGGKAVE